MADILLLLMASLQLGDCRVILFFFLSFFSFNVVIMEMDIASAPLTGIFHQLWVFFLTIVLSCTILQGTKG